MSDLAGNKGELSEGQLTGRQRVLYVELQKREGVLADMYNGARLVLEQEQNPDRLALAAHGFRELMEKLSRHLSVAPKRPSLSPAGMLRELSERWNRARKSTCYSADSGWAGPIDDHLRKFLSKVASLLEQFDQAIPTRKTRVAEVVGSLDPSDAPLPRRIGDLRVEEWDRCDSYFQSVSHHNAKDLTEAEFLRYVDVLETFLVDRLRPRTFDHQDEIDTIIREGKEDAQS